MEMKYHDILEQRLCKELDTLEAKYAQNPNQDMSTQDLERMDVIYHALKSRATYIAMKEAENYEMNGYSGRQMRNPSNGRYMSGRSYSDGYANGYADGMNQSGNHMMPNGYPPNRW